MVKVGIMLNDVENIRKLNNEASKYDFDIDVKNGKYMVSAKSILGIMGIASRDVMELRIETDSKRAQPLINSVQEMLVGSPSQW